MTPFFSLLSLGALWAVLALATPWIQKNRRGSLLLIALLIPWIFLDWLAVTNTPEYAPILGRLAGFYGVAWFLARTPPLEKPARLLRGLVYSAFLAHGLTGLVLTYTGATQHPLEAGVMLWASALLCIVLLHHYGLMTQRLHATVMVILALWMTITTMGLMDLYETHVGWQLIFLGAPLAFYASFYIAMDRIPPASFAGPSNMGAYGLAGTLVLGGYQFLDPYNDFLPSIVMAFLSFGCLEVAHTLARRSASPLWIHSFIHGGLVFFYALFGFHLLVHLQSEAFVTPYASLRQMFGILILIQATYWYLDLNFLHKVSLESRQKNILARTRIGRRILEKVLQLPLEVGLATALLLVALEVRVPWQPVAYMVLSGVFLSRRAHYYLPPRGLFYGMGLLILAMAMVGAVLPIWVSPLHDWGNNSWVSVPVALGLALAVALRLRYLYRWKLPQGGRILHALAPALNGILFLPIFLGAVYFYLERLPRNTFLWIYGLLIGILLGLAFFLKSRLLALTATMAILAGWWV